MARMLIVDDEENIAGTLQTYLEHAGHEVWVACDGFDGWSAYLGLRPDLVILDLFMPKKGGLALLRDIRAQDPGTKVVVISGGDPRGKLDLLSTAETFADVRVVRKPFPLREILRVANELLGVISPDGPRSSHSAAAPRHA